MQTFKRLLWSLVLPLIFMLSQPVYAVDITGQACSQGNGAAKGSALCGDSNGGGSNPIVGPNGVLTHVVEIFSAVVGIAAVIMIVIAGMRFVMSSGDAQGVSQAKQSLIYAIVGVVVAALAQGIVALVLTKL